MTSACERNQENVKCRMDRRDQGFLYFCLDDCSAPAESYQAAMEIMEEAEEKGVTLMDFESGCGSTCYSLCEKLDDPSSDGVIRFVRQMKEFSAIAELNELSKVTKEEVELCIRTMWMNLLDVENGCFVMTCPQDKVEEYAEDFRDLGFEIDVRDYEEVLNSSFSLSVCSFSFTLRYISWEDL